MDNESEIVLVVPARYVLRLRTRHARCVLDAADETLARADGSYGTLMKRFSKSGLLVIDDLELTHLNDTERRDLLEVVEDLSGSASTSIASQLPVENWHDHIGVRRLPMLSWTDSFAMSTASN